MKVLVMTAIAENGRDLQIVMTAQIDGAMQTSPVMVKVGAADSRAGNPYLVYGDAVAKFTGRDKFDTSISVFDCHSGDFSAWEGFDFPTPPLGA